MFLDDSTLCGQKGRGAALRALEQAKRIVYGYGTFERSTTLCGRGLYMSVRVQRTRQITVPLLQSPKV